MDARYAAESAGQGAADVLDPHAPNYSFDGYTIEVSEKVALTPLADRRHHEHHGHGRRGQRDAR